MFEDGIVLKCVSVGLLVCLSVREEQYRVLWGELETLAKAYSSNSDRHHMLQEFIAKTMAACPSCSQQLPRKIATPHTGMADTVEEASPLMCSNC